MGSKETVAVVEATKVVDQYISRLIGENYEALVEIINGGDQVTNIDVIVAQRLVREMNCLLGILLRGNDDVYENEKYHLFQDPNGCLFLIRGREIGDEPF